MVPRQLLAFRVIHEPRQRQPCREDKSADCLVGEERGRGAALQDVVDARAVKGEAVCLFFFSRENRKWRVCVSVFEV